MTQESAMSSEKHFVQFLQGMADNTAIDSLNRFKQVVRSSQSVDNIIAFLQTTPTVNTDPKALMATLDAIQRARNISKPVDANLEPVYDGGIAALAQIEANVASILSSIFQIQSKAAKANMNAPMGSKTIVIIVGIALVGIILFGAGIPIIISYFRRKKNSKEPKDADITLPVGKNMGFTVAESLLVGGKHIMTSDQTKYQSSNDMCTYTILMNMNRLSATNDEQILFARSMYENSDSVALRQPVLKVRLDKEVNRMFVEFAQEGGGNKPQYCTFTIDDVPMYRWFVLHIVYNNTPKYKVAHVYFDGGLVKLCHLFLCPSPLKRHDGNTMFFGWQNGNPASTRLPEAKFKYFKYSNYTLQPDDIAKEASSLLSAVSRQIKAIQKEVGCSTKAALPPK